MSDAKFIRCNECRALNEPRALFCSRCGASLYGPTHGGPGHKRRRVTAAGVTMAVALLLALAIVTFVLATIIIRTLDTSENVDPYSSMSGIPATIGATGTQTSSGSGSSIVSTASTLAPVQVRPNAAVSSSILEATSTNSYRPTNLLDGDLATAWLEGEDGPGLGEWVRLDFSKPKVIARIEIANGYQKDDERFLGDPRVKTIKVEYSTGATKLVELADTKEFQSITPPDEAVDWVRFVIISVYPGDDWEDTALSEVRIFERVE